MLCGLLSSCRGQGGSLIAACGLLFEAASLCRARALGCTCHGLCGTWIVSARHRLSSCGAGAWLLRGTWCLPGSGMEPVSPAFTGRVFSRQVWLEEEIPHLLAPRFAASGYMRTHAHTNTHTQDYHTAHTAHMHATQHTHTGAHMYTRSYTHRVPTPQTRHTCTPHNTCTRTCTHRAPTPPSHMHTHVHTHSCTLTEPPHHHAHMHTHMYTHTTVHTQSSHTAHAIHAHTHVYTHTGPPHHT